MIATHIVGLTLHPDREFHNADEHPASIIDIVLHVALMSLIPAVCGYIATAHLGWDIGVGNPYVLPESTALMIALAAYVALNTGVYFLGYGIYWMAKTFDATPTLRHCIELAVYTSTPLFLLGFTALYPVILFNVLVGLFAVGASVYLLYKGLPIFMHIPETQGFVFSSSVVTVGLCLLVGIITSFIILINNILDII